MSHRPIPPPPVRFPTRAAAPHVQTAVAQAKLPAAPAPRGPAPHVQAAVAQARMASPPPPRGAAPPAQAAARVPQPHRPPVAPPPPPARPPQAAHVQRALNTVQPKAPQPARNVPAPPVRQRPAQVRPLAVQLAKRKLEIDEEEDDERVKKRKLDRISTLSTSIPPRPLPLVLPPTFPNLSFLPPITSPTVLDPRRSPLLDLPPLLTIPSFMPSYVPSFVPSYIPSFTPPQSGSSFGFDLSFPFIPPLSTPNLVKPVPQSPSSVVSVYDPTTQELSDLAKSAQDLFAYEGSEAYVNQRIVKLYDVSGVTFNPRSTGSVHAALQINHMTPLISVSGGYGVPGKVVRTWMEGLTWKNEEGETLKGFTSPSIGDSSIRFEIPKKITKKSSHRFSAHAEVNAYRELYKLYMADQATPSSIVKFRMATNIAHCAECWWAAHALFTKLGIDVGKLETSSPTENVLFNQWTEPWEDFYKDLGMDSSPFRDKKGKLKGEFKKNKKADPLELNKLQKDVTFL